MTDRIDFINLTAIRLQGRPAGWQWCKLDALEKPEDFFVCKGAVPVGVISRGPRKGCTKWGDVLDTLWIRFSEVRETERLWEQENGKCHKCLGTGQEVSSVGVGGTTYRACGRCNATGKPKVSK